VNTCQHVAGTARRSVLGLHGTQARPSEVGDFLRVYDRYKRRDYFR